MRKKFLLLLIFASCSAPCFAYKVTTFQPLQPMQPMKPLSQQELNYNNSYTNESYPKITQVESILFSSTFERETIYKRLGRIESKMFRRQFQGMPLASRMENILANIDEGQMYGIASRDLTKLESKVFGRSFAGEDSDSRITRLEKEMLGAMQQGNLKHRYETVRTAARHYNAFPQETARNSAFTPNNYYNTNKKAPLLTRIVDGLIGGFGMGTMTGFTPPIYDTYPQNAGQYQYPGSGAGMQDYYMGNTGGYYNNRNIGSGAGIRILN